MQNSDRMLFNGSKERNIQENSKQNTNIIQLILCKRGICVIKIVTSNHVDD